MLSNKCSHHMHIVSFLRNLKHEIFDDDGSFIQIRPVWVGDIGTRPQIQLV